MLSVLKRGGIVSLLALLIYQGLPAQAARSGTQQQASVVRAVQSRIRHHQSPARYLTPTVTLQVGKTRLHGQQAATAWWQKQYRQKLRLPVVSAIVWRKAVAETIVRWVTKAGSSWRRMTYTFQAGKVRCLTITRIAAPTSPSPPRHVPHPPTLPPPHATPTIPT